MNRTDEQMDMYSENYMAAMEWHYDKFGDYTEDEQEDLSEWVSQNLNQYPEAYDKKLNMDEINWRTIDNIVHDAQVKKWHDDMKNGIFPIPPAIME